MKTFHFIALICGYVIKQMKSPIDVIAKNRVKTIMPPTKRAQIASDFKIMIARGISPKTFFHN